MAKKPEGGFEEASLDDFFQPPAGEEAPGPQPGGKIRGKAAPASGDLFGAEPQAQVEDIPVSSAAGGDPDKKKKALIIGGAALGVLLLLGLAYFLFFMGEEVPAPPPAPVPAAAPPPPVPRPALKVTRLSDLDRAPASVHVLGSKLVDPVTVKFSEEGAKKVAELKGPYLLYIGTFVAPPNLEAAKEKLRVAGLIPDTKSGRAKVTMHRLHVGNFDTLAQAQGAVKKLRSAGFDAFLDRERPGSYQVFAGSFFTRAQFDEHKKKLTDKATGFTGSMQSVTVEMKINELWARPKPGASFVNAGEAETGLVAVLKQGVEADLAVAK